MDDDVTPLQPIPSVSPVTTSSPIPPVSGKEKKADIIEKYKELKKRYEQRAASAPQRKVAKEREREDAIVASAQSYSVEDIARENAALEEHTRSSFSEMRVRMEQHARKLADLKEAISIVEKRLKEVHDIDTAADSLADLIAAHEDSKREFEEGLEVQHAEWKREQEEYTYATKIGRERDRVEYEARKSALERELSERREALQREEQDIAALRKRAAIFDEELCDAVESAREETEMRIRGEESAKAQLLGEQVKRERGIVIYRNESLEKENAELRKEITAQKEQLQQAHAEAKELAVKVIEGASGERSLRDVSRIAMQQAKVTTE